MADERLIMLPGECWYTNVNFVHSVANRGTEDRVHLVIDGVRNEWTDELFFALAPESSFQSVREENLSRETIVRMLEELKNNPQMVNHPLVSELEEKLKSRS
ncbi:aspartyl/asparaginyl beta-hydroxylase domain-containing protein [Fluviicola sp.]|uniref:aspartyl/asparaginyl beta-hydroxylase domain-containing protein n=1 Tax=Fluviicola sp. TaxID=1917219 RepID=UPI003D2D5688